VLAVTGGAALIGLALVRWLGPVPLATLLAVLLVALMLDRLRLTCPPAFAVALLPFVIRSPATGFPLHVLVGTGWLVVVTVLTATLRRRRGG
jgi:CBS-domain-containing membrane protein